LTTGTDLVLSLSVAFFQLTGKSKRYTEASFLRKIRLLIVDAQLPATAVSIGLLVLLMVDNRSPILSLWLGLPLIYPINVLSTLTARRSIRDDLEADVGGQRAFDENTKEEMAQIPPPEHRPSFLLAPFPSIVVRRASTEIRKASDKLSQYTQPILVPAISGVRRASAFLGVIPPASKSNSKRKGFPFKGRKGKPEAARSPGEIHPASLHYPLQADAAPMGKSAKCLERSHSLAPLDAPEGLTINLGQTTANNNFFGPDQRHPELHDPFSHPSPTAGIRDPSPHPTIEEALEAHEIFEMPGTPDGLSPKSGHSPLVADPMAFDIPAEWK
jgi:hypothetical protein